MEYLQPLLPKQVQGRRARMLPCSAMSAGPVCCPHVVVLGMDREAGCTSPLVLRMFASFSTAAAARAARVQADLELAAACELAAAPPACLAAALPGAAEPAAGAEAPSGAAGAAGCGADPAGPGPACALRARAAAALEGLTAHALLGLADAGGTLQAPLPCRTVAGFSCGRRRPSASCALCEASRVGACPASVRS